MLVNTKISSILKLITFIYFRVQLLIRTLKYVAAYFKRSYREGEKMENIQNKNVAELQQIINAQQERINALEEDNEVLWNQNDELRSEKYYLKKELEIWRKSSIKNASLGRQLAKELMEGV